MNKPNCKGGGLQGGGGGGVKVGTVFEASQPGISPEISLSAHSRSS